MLSESINVRLGLTPNCRLHVGIAAPIYLPLLSDYLHNADTIEVEGMGGFSVTYLVRGLLSLGVKVSVYTLDPRQTKPLLIEGSRLRVYCGHFRTHGRMKELMRLERKQLEDFMAVDDPDLIHAHWTYEYAWAAVASGKPNLITVRDWSPAILSYHKDLYRLGRFLMDRITLRRGRNFSVNSPYLRECVSRTVGQAVHITPNSIPAEWFLKGEKEIGKNGLTLLSINNGFSERKNVGNLLKAFKIVRQHLASARLLLVGHGYESDGRAVVWAQSEDLTDGVKFFGKNSNEEIRELLDLSDILVHPALEESFGMTLVEAMARKVPVIAGQSSGAVPWVLSGGEAGLLVDVSSVDTLVQSILRLAMDRGLWKSFSESGYRNALRRFNSNEVAKDVISLYHQVIEET